VGLFFFALLQILGRPIAGLFTNAPDVVGVTVVYLRIVPIAYALQGVYLLSAPGLNVMQKPFLAASLGAGEMLVLIAPLALLGSRVAGIPGVFAGIALGYAVTGLLSRVAFIRTINALSTTGGTGRSF
jgi:Na+-driven multidrug efflux pump